MSANTNENQERGISGIAHHFLSQCDPAKPPVRQAPDSTPQTTPHPTTPQATPHCQEPASPPLNDNTNQPDDHDSPMGPPPFPPHWRQQQQRTDASRPKTPSPLAGVALLADHLQHNRQRTLQFAQQWADKNGPVLMLDLACPNPELIQVLPAVNQPDEPDHLDGPVDQFWQQLFGEDTTSPQPKLANAALTQLLQQHANLDQILLINLPTEQRDQARTILQQCRHAVVLASHQSAELVEAYKTLKWVSPLAWDDLDVSVFVCGGDNESHARTIQKKLADTAWEFLGVDVRWGGWAAQDEPVRHTTLAQVTPAEALWSELKALLQNTTQYTPPNHDDSAVRRPQETSTQASGLERESSDDLLPTASSAADPFSDEPPQQTKTHQPTPTTQHTTQPTAPQTLDKTPSPDPTQTPPPPLTTPKTPTTIPVPHPPQANRHLSDALQLALPAWLTSLPQTIALPVTLPAELDPAARILVDTTGRAHVMLASITPDQGLLTRALAVRAHLLNHLTQIAQQTTQLQIDTNAPVGLILISPAPADPLRQLCQQLADLPCQIFQLHLTHTDDACSLLLL